MDEAPDASATFACPSCSQEVEVSPGPLEQEITCPQCSAVFTVPAVHLEEPEGAGTREHELSTLRIRQLGAAKRAAYRSRSYAVIGIIFCTAAAGQLVWNAIVRIRRDGWTVWSILFLAFAGLFIWLSIYLVRRAIDLTREAKETRLQDPATPPDFSQLGDGSDRWKNLENIE